MLCCLGFEKLSKFRVLNTFRERKKRGLIFISKRKRMCEMRIHEKFYIYRQRERHENTF